MTYRVNYNGVSVSNRFKTLKEAKEELKSQQDYDIRYNQQSNGIIQKFDGYEWVSIILKKD